MFLCPQHLQSFDRELTARIHAAEQLGVPGASGLLRLKVDQGALERDAFTVLEASAVFPDGTLANFPGSATVEQRGFGEFFEGAHLDVYLGIPARQPGRPALGERNDPSARYHAEALDLFDENLPGEPRQLEARVLHGRLFFGDEERSGFECLHIAQLVRRGRPETVSALSEEFVPTLLAAGASEVLMRRLGELANGLRSQARDLAARLPGTAGLSSVEKGADLTGFLKLQTVNQCLAPLANLANSPDLHPYFVHLELTRALGTLAIFDDERVVPELAAYAHERQNEGFAEVLGEVQRLIPSEVAVPYAKSDFVADPQRTGFYACELPEEAGEGSPIYYLGVRFAKSAADVAQLVSTGIKLLPEADLDRVLQGVVPGIELELVRIAPLAFPKQPDLHYFRIATEGSSRNAWLAIAKERRAVLLTALGGSGAEFALYVELA